MSPTRGEASAILEVLRPSQVAAAMRSGLCPADDDFDRFLPGHLQLASRQHWTPLAVAARVAACLDELKVRTVVDIGSGAGKFCVAAALMSRCHFLGIEHRRELVSVARALSELFQVQDRVGFVEETFGDTPPPNADAYYLFNPFAENVFGSGAQFDRTVNLSRARYDDDVHATEYWLGAAPLGTYAVIYNGFGGTLPDSYVALRTERGLPCPLKIWRKTRD